jgi:lipid II:glycine glycyltransferase (peptidoglycan interpeptide bridge formation enzyme)
MLAMVLSSIPVEQLSNSGHPFQSPYWAYLKKKNGWRPFAFHLECEELDVSENFLVLARSIGHIFNIAYIPFPPLKIEQSPSSAFYIEMLSKKIKTFLPIPLLFIRYDLPFTFTDEDKVATIKGKRVRECAQSVQPEGTSIIDLTDGYEEVTTRYRQRAHRAIRKVHQNEIKIEEYENDQNLFDQWYDLYKETAKRDGFSTRSKQYISHLLHEPKVKNSSSLIVATCKNMIVGGIITISTKDVSVYLLGASKRIQGISPSYLLQDYSIKKSCENGCKIYDLHGIAGPGTKGSHLSNLTLFKQAFGGQSYFRPSSTDYINLRLLYWVYRMFENFRYTMNRKKGPKMNTQQYGTTQDN